MIERIVSLDPQKAYEELKNLLMRNDCRIVREEPSKTIVVEHGSVFGMTSKSIEKRITFTLIPYENKTRIISVTSLTKDLTYTIIFIYVMSVAILIVYGFLVAEMISFVSLIRQIIIKNPLMPSQFYNIYHDLLYASQIAIIIYIIMIISLIIGVIHTIYIYLRRERFSEEILRYLS
ncbi:MAG: hypothetical protein GU359_00980 [Desulfurococcales archaeon]|nr:hypothetical protein [Desulfurococcales archaeon]